MNNREVGPQFHVPVMVNEVLEYLEVQNRRSGTFIDATTSTGGHAEAIANELNPSGMIIGLDLDKEALKKANNRLEGKKPEVKLYQSNYKNLDLVLERENITAVDGILFDLGFSSVQVENPDRGFSFQQDGPLDMRMNQESDLTARRIVNTYEYKKLKSILYKYGEERYAPQISRKIVEARKEKQIKTTSRLTELIKEAIPKKAQVTSKIHPATKTFQALRIVVNDELANLEQGLEKAFKALVKGGNIVVLSYHSLEDKRVKGFFTYKEKDCICPPELPVCRCDKVQELELLTEGVLRPTEEQIEKNPRSRSARLRAARKLTSRE